MYLGKMFVHNNLILCYNMQSGNIPAGKTIYLTKNNCDILYIKPGKTVINDTMYVAYDVKIGDLVVIPKGTRVQGDWVTEHTPELAAQFQLTSIYFPIPNSFQFTRHHITGDSMIIARSAAFNLQDVEYHDYFYQKATINMSKSVTHRIVEIGHKTKTLDDSILDTVYVEIDTKEISVILSSDFRL